MLTFSAVRGLALGQPLTRKIKVSGRADVLSVVTVISEEEESGYCSTFCSRAQV